MDSVGAPAGRSAAIPSRSAPDLLAADPGLEHEDSPFVGRTPSGGGTVARKNHGDANADIGLQLSPIVINNLAPPDAPARPTVLDTFCGIGGSSLGATMAGYDVVMATDGCPTACAAYAVNAPGHPVVCADASSSAPFLAALASAAKASGTPASFDCILVSLPCQGFSTASTNRRTDPRRDLGSLFLPSLLALRPTVVVFENVCGFGISGEWAALKTALLRRFDVQEHVISAARCGVPQRRNRFFAACVPRGSEDRLSPAVAALDSRPETTMRQVFPDLRTYFHCPRGASDPGVFDSDRPAPTVRTTCAAKPNKDRYRPRRRDAGPIADASVLSVADWARVQGFPTTWVLPSTTASCSCRFCSSSRRRPAPRLVGNAVCPAVMAFVLRHLAHLFGGKRPRP